MSNWISAKDGQPATDGIYLCTLDLHSVVGSDCKTIEALRYSLGCWLYDGKETNLVTHWQPLPGLPEGHPLPEEQNMENEKNNLFVLDDYWRAKLQDTFMELLAASVKRPDEEEEIMNLIERVCDCILFLRTGEGL